MVNIKACKGASEKVVELWKVEGLRSFSAIARHPDLLALTKNPITSVQVETALKKAQPAIPNVIDQPIKAPGSGTFCF
jgi:hypothetical protein